MNPQHFIADNAPPTPPCVSRRAAWIEFLQAAYAAQSCRTEPKVIFYIKGRHVFNYDFPMCDECDPQHAKDMKAQGRCDPGWLKRMAVKPVEATT